jgi:histidinol-phosphate/aromatic aminotransferase/cobyric acid decarboxylase-like protein
VASGGEGLLPSRSGGSAITKALKRAFEAASRLPDPDQDELAAAILEELETDERWEVAFGRSQDVLARLADEAPEEHGAGRTEPLDPDAL